MSDDCVVWGWVAKQQTNKFIPLREQGQGMVDLP